MKRSFLTIFCFVLLLSGLNAIHAQQGMKPLRNLGIGIEVGTTGVGFDLAMPVNNFMVVRGGYSFFPYSYSDSYNVNFNNNNREAIQTAINSHPDILAELERRNLPTNVNNLNDEVDLDAKLGLSNGKLVVDFYPFQKSSFHVVAGLYMGKSRLIKLNGNIDPQAAEILNIIKQETDISFPTSISFEEYTIQADDKGRIEAALKINKVKPYLGIGFGNSIPKKRVGFHFEIGAMYQGKPEIISDNGTVYKDPSNEDGSSGVTKVLEKISVYPMVSFKLTGRIL